MNDSAVLEVVVNLPERDPLVIKKYIELREFFLDNKIIGQPSRVFKNREILYKDNQNAVGFVSVSMKFKHSPSLNIALVETNLDNL